MLENEYEMIFVGTSKDPGTSSGFFDPLRDTKRVMKCFLLSHILLSYNFLSTSHSLLEIIEKNILIPVATIITHKVPLLQIKIINKLYNL